MLGRNGMGKTTLIRSIVGFTPPRRGRVSFRGADITGWPPFRRAARHGAGSAGTPIFASLSVRENLEVAARGGQGRWNREGVYELFPRLRERASSRANKLSGGEQQMLAIGRA